MVCVTGLGSYPHRRCDHGHRSLAAAHRPRDSGLPHRPQLPRAAGSRWSCMSVPVLACRCTTCKPTFPISYCARQRGTSDSPPRTRSSDSGQGSRCDGGNEAAGAWRSLRHRASRRRRSAFLPLPRLCGGAEAVDACGLRRRQGRAAMARARGEASRVQISVNCEDRSPWQGRHCSSRSGS